MVNQGQRAKQNRRENTNREIIKRKPNRYCEAENYT